MPEPLAEKRSQGPLIATIDLLFLLVSFFVLLLYFSQQRQSEAQIQLEAAQQTLARITGEEQADVSATLAEMAPLLETFMVRQREDAERTRRAAAQEVRRRARETFKLTYEVLPGGQVRHEQRTYALPAFKAEVVDALRRTYWISFRAAARPETPFGEVVAQRKLVLENAGEFDTYWDNVTQRQDDAKR
jgi:hypothetical protein